MVVLGGLCCLLAVAVGCVPRIEAFLSAPQRCCSAAVCTPGLGKVCPLSSPLHLPFTKETANSGVRASPLNRKPALSHSDSAESASAQPGSTAAVATATAETEGNEGIPREFANELIESFGLYAVSTIHARALPDTRDGLKPVHRRILFAMQSKRYAAGTRRGVYTYRSVWSVCLRSVSQQLGLNHSGPFRKSARVVGEVLGKFHPHGDKAVYDALVRLAQPFVSHLPLVEGHGNFGSVDGDPAAAMRYTECRLSAFCQDALFKDLHTSACSFRPNFDATEVQCQPRFPLSLPAKACALFLPMTSGVYFEPFGLCGVEGIGLVAMGLATSLPPHNLKEVVAACIALIDSLYRLLPAPDFPTGGLLVEGSAAALAYKEGHGSLRLRARGFLEQKTKPRHFTARQKHEGHDEADSEHTQIVVTELPYGVNKGELVRLATRLAADRLLPGVAAVRDESDFSGIRVVFELSPEVPPREAWKHLLARTPLEVSVQCNFVALKDGKEPQRLSLSLLRLQQQQQQQKLEETRQKAVKLRHLLSDDRELYGVIKEELLEVATKYGVPRKTRFLRGGPPGSSQAIDADAILNGGRDESAETPKDTKRGPPVVLHIRAPAESTAPHIFRDRICMRLHVFVLELSLIRIKASTPLTVQRDSCLGMYLVMLCWTYAWRLRVTTHCMRLHERGENRYLLPVCAAVLRSDDVCVFLNSYLLLVTEGGLYKRIPEAALSLQRRGSTGQRCQSAGGVRAAAGTKWTVEASQSLDTTSRSSSKMSAVVAATACRDSDWLMLIWRDGRCLSLRGQQLQRHGLKASGSPLAAAVYSSRRRVTGKAAAADGTGEAGDVAGEGLCCVVQVNSGETDGRLVVATQKGLVKAVPLRLLLPSGTARKQRLRRLLALRRGDQVAGCVTISEGGQQKGAAENQKETEAAAAEAQKGCSIVIGTAHGCALRFDGQALRDATPLSHGIKGITLRKGDRVVAVTAVPSEAEPAKGHLLLVTERGRGKLLSLKHLKLQRRGGTGSSIIRLQSPKGPPCEGASGKESSEGLKDEAANGPTEQPAALLLGESKEKGFALKKRKLAHDETRERDSLCALRWVGQSQRSPHQEVAILSRGGFLARLEVASVPLHSNKRSRGATLLKLKEGQRQAADAASAAVLLYEQPPRRGESDDAKRKVQTEEGTTMPSPAARADVGTLSENS
ncbi:DNA gyrase subunit [Cyclospora cayetanensis]|uniref:DNA topoisomerase (ATP-hydrolyzing) n=1 Tax=Cyclospora cayetanensis TaxID=88456 RepID=A0A1D3D810_9EIME|nr:DNA gyrase subunit [Cyclospora cayetanensis]